jgi:hypothetical protein
MLLKPASYGIVIGGKGGEGRGTETRPRSLNSTLPIIHPVQKEVSHGQQAEEKEEDEEVTTPRGLHVKPRRQLLIREAP